MTTARTILNEARHSKGWSIEYLREQSKVKTSSSNLRRKLEITESRQRGGRVIVALDPIEVKQLAAALDVEVPDSVLLADLIAGRVTRQRAAHDDRSRVVVRKRRAA